MVARMGRLQKDTGIVIAHSRWITLAGLLMLSACAGNQYGPPEGQPTNWGQQHYLDNERYQQWTQDRMQA